MRRVINPDDEQDPYAADALRNAMGQHVAQNPAPPFGVPDERGNQPVHGDAPPPDTGWSENNPFDPPPATATVPKPSDTYTDTGTYIPDGTGAAKPFTPAVNNSGSGQDAQELQWLNWVKNATHGTDSGGFISGGAGYKNNANLQQLADQYSAQFGGNARAVGDDKIDFGDGRGPVDVITSDGQFWYQNPDAAGPNAQGGAGGQGGTGGAGGQGGSMGTDLMNELIKRLSGAGGPQLINSSPNEGVIGGGPQRINSSPNEGVGGDPMRQQIMDALSQLIKQGQEPVGDVSGTPEAKAYALSSQRNAERNRSAAMERRASQGLLFSGAADTDINAAQQQQAEEQSTYEAQLTHTILTDRKDKLENALKLGAGIMATDQQLQLQKELQTVNAELARTSIQLQLAQALMQNQRFYDDLGYRIGTTELGANQNAINSLNG